MAAEEFKKAVSGEELQLQQKEPITNPEDLLQSSLKALEKFGGFQLLKGLAKGMENMDPRRKAVKSIFLKEDAYKEMRDQLQKVLARWVEVLESGETDPNVIIDSCRTKGDRAMANLSENLLCVHDRLKSLEISYRSLDAFFANAGHGKVNWLNLMNVGRDDKQLCKNDSEETEAIRKELEKNHDNLNLKGNYSLLVIPGYLGDADIVRMWAKTANDNKVILVTDFEDTMGKYDDLYLQLDKASLKGTDAFMGNVVMTVNYILGRKKSETAREDDDLFIPASGALAAKMSNVDDTVISQAISGKKYGTLDNVKCARLDLAKSEIAALIDMGVVPIVESDGRTMAFSNRTLYTGATGGLREYSIVRIFDWIGKVLEQYANDHHGENWSSAVGEKIRSDVNDFLSECKRPETGLIESYKDLKVESEDGNNIRINVELKPFHAMENFYIELTGKKEEAGYNWNSNAEVREK